jgi:hypothetical protein
MTNKINFLNFYTKNLNGQQSKKKSGCFFLPDSPVKQKIFYFGMFLQITIKACLLRLKIFFLTVRLENVSFVIYPITDGIVKLRDGPQ